MLWEGAWQEANINTALHGHLTSYCLFFSRFMGKSLSGSQDGWRMLWVMWLWRVMLLLEIKSCFCLRALLVCWSDGAALNHCLDLSSRLILAGVSCCPGSECKEVSSSFSCCPQAWKLLISKKQRSNFAVSAFESGRDGEHSEKWGNYVWVSVLACF